MAPYLEAAADVEGEICGKIGERIRKRKTKLESDNDPFLDEPSHLYKRSFPSVRQSVGPSVGP